MKIPTPVTSGAQQLGGEAFVPVQIGSFSLSHPTPPMKTFEGAAWQGGQLAKMGAGLSQFAQQVQQVYDQNKLLEIEHDWYDFENQLLDPASGILSQFGVNAVGVTEATNAAIDDFQKNHGYGGLSMAGKRAADRLMMQRGGAMLSQARNQERSELVKSFVGNLEAGLEQQIDVMGSAPLSESGDDRFDAALTNMKQKVDELGNVLGWTDAERETKLQVYTTAGVLSRVNAIATGDMQTSKDPTAAIGYLQENFRAGLVDPETYNQAMATLKPVWIQHQGMLEAAGAGVDDWNERWNTEFGSTYNQPLWSQYGANDRVSLRTVAESAAAEAEQADVSATMSANEMLAAQALAGRQPGAIVSPNGTVATGPMPQLTSGVQAMSMAIPFAGALTIGSGYRPPERQAEIVEGKLAEYGLSGQQWATDKARLYAKYGEREGAIRLGIEWEARLRATGMDKWVAPPGMSYHQKGMAGDLQWNGQGLGSAPAEVQRWVHGNAAKYGLHFPMSWEPWHVEMLGTRGTSGPTAGMVSAPAQGGGVAYIPRGSEMGMVGGAQAGGGLWQPTLGKAHTGKGNPQHRDYSQLYRVYSYEQMPGGVQVGVRNGRPVYAAPDYLKDESGAYLSVAAEDAANPGQSAVHIAEKNGWLIPTEAEIHAVRQASKYAGVAMVTSGDMGAKAGTGDSAKFTSMQHERLRKAGWSEGEIVAFAKELGMPNSLAERTSQQAPGTPQMGDQWMPQNLPQGADPNKVGYLMQTFTQSGMGITPEMAAGIIGSLMQESGPQLGQDLTNSIGAHGIAQWLKDRRTKLQNFASGRGTNENDFATQAAFILHELQTTERDAYQKLLQAKTPEEAADIWTLHFERPGKDERHLAKRRAYARQVYGQGGVPVPGAYQAAPGTPAGNPYGMSAGASRIYNLPQGTPDQMEIRLAAMKAYSADQEWISKQQNAQTSALIDQLTTEFYNAGPGSEFTDIVTPEIAQQLGSQLPGVQAIHQKISSGAANAGDPDLSWEWTKKFIDVAKSGDFTSVLNEWEDPSVQAHLRSTLSTGQIAELTEYAKSAYAAQGGPTNPDGTPNNAAAEAAAYNARIPASGRIEDAAKRALYKQGITDPNEIAALMPGIAGTMVQGLTALALDVQGSVEGDIPLEAVANRAVTQIELPMAKGAAGGIKVEAGTFGAILQTIDRVYEDEGLTTLDLVEQGIEIEGSPIPPRLLEKIYDGYEATNPRAPKPSELLGLTVRFVEANSPGGGLYLSGRLLPQALGGGSVGTVTTTGSPPAMPFLLGESIIPSGQHGGRQDWWAQEQRLGRYGAGQ